MFINLPLSFPTDKFQELVGLPLKTTVFFVLCLGHTLGQQLGPPPALFAPPLPKGFVEKAAPDTPLGYTVSVDVTAPEAFQGSLKSALLLELRKRPDVVITGTSGPDYRWRLVCVTSADLLVCSSLGRQNLRLAQIEKYYPDLTNYGVWWSKRYLMENESSGGGWVAYHGVITDSASAIPRFAMRAAAAFEASTLEPARKNKADSLRKK